MFSVVTRLWDGHYTEIRFSLNSRPRKINSYINELEIARSGLSGIMTVIVLLSRFELSNQQREGLGAALCHQRRKGACGDEEETSHWN